MPGKAEELFAKATPAAGVFSVVFLAGYLASTHPPHDLLGYLIGRDFVSMWMGGHAAVTGSTHDLYDFVRLQVELHRLFGPLPQQSFGYPPPMLFLLWPLGFLPYLVGLAVWSAVGLALYLAVAADGGRRDLLFLAVAPAVAINLFTGQNGFFTAALIILALCHLDRRPILAGIFLGLLIIKPQLGLLFPLALALSGRWRVFASATATALLFSTASVLVFGPDVWRDFLHFGTTIQSHILDHATGMLVWMMPTAFMNARLLGASPSVAWMIQAPFSVLAIAAVAWTFKRRRDPDLSAAVLVTASFVVTPYVFGYDMVVFGWLIAKLRPRFAMAADGRLALAVWTLPVTTILLGLCRLPLSAAILAAFLIRLVWLLRRQPASDLPTEPRSAIASSSRAMMPTSPARSHLRGS